MPAGMGKPHSDSLSPAFSPLRQIACRCYTFRCCSHPTPQQKPDTQPQCGSQTLSIFVAHLPGRAGKARPLSRLLSLSASPNRVCLTSSQFGRPRPTQHLMWAASILRRAGPEGTLFAFGGRQHTETGEIWSMSRGTRYPTALAESCYSLIPLPELIESASLW
jgi:hypothetical protein